jgi:hypothetical protein
VASLPDSRWGASIGVRRRNASSRPRCCTRPSISSREFAREIGDEHGGAADYATA